MVRPTSAVHLQDAVQITVWPSEAVPGGFAGATACQAVLQFAFNGIPLFRQAAAFQWCFRTKNVT